jgi:hypothetical protein
MSSYSDLLKLEGLTEAFAKNTARTNPTPEMEELLAKIMEANNSTISNEEKTEKDKILGRIAKIIEEKEEEQERQRLIYEGLPGHTLSRPTTPNASGKTARKRRNRRNRRNRRTRRNRQ